MIEFGKFDSLDALLAKLSGEKTCAVIEVILRVAGCSPERHIIAGTDAVYMAGSPLRDEVLTWSESAEAKALAAAAVRRDGVLSYILRPRFNPHDPKSAELARLYQATVYGR